MASLISQFTLLKSNCVLCNDQIEEKVSLCQACRDDLPRIECACKMCALPMEANTNSQFCGQCLSQKTYVDYTESLFFYDNPIDYLISQMKFQQQLSVVAVLADLLKEHIETGVSKHGFPDVILPMPLHKIRLTKRGFNQSLEIIKPLAKAKDIPIELNLVERSKATQSQTNLNRKQRKKNVSGCFSLITKPNYSHIVIVDDVITTGASVNELAKLLKKSGVDKVGVWSIARAELS